MSNDFTGQVLGVFTRAVALVMALLLMAAVGLGAAEVVILFARQLANPPMWIVDLDEFRVLFGFFLLVLVGLQLLEVVRASLADGRIHVDAVLLAGVIVVVQRIVNTDYATQPQALLASAAAVLALCGGHFLMRRGAGAGKGAGVPPGRQRKWEGEA